MRRVPLYRGVGLSIAVASSVLTLLTYTFLGLNPLLAFWIGLTIVGLSMYVTPTEVKVHELVIPLILNSLENIARVLETFGIGSKAVYRAIGDDVYIVITHKGKTPASTDVHKKLVSIEGGDVVLSIKSFISRSLIGESSDVCSSINYLIIDLLAIASSVKCIDEGGKVVVEVLNPKLSTPGSLEKVTGSIYGVISASITALIKGKDVVVREGSSDSKKILIVEVIR